jgi:small conductance mechanosensitive channel
MYLDIELISELLKNNPWLSKVFISISIIVVGVCFYILLSKLISNKLESYKFFKGTKSKTYLNVIKSVNKYLFAIVILLLILSLYGIDITSIATGVGVLGIIFGFAIQDALKDIIKGIDIVSDSYYQIGDVIRVDSYTGKVLSIGIKTTKIEDIFEKNIVSISNRNIEKVEVLSKMINIDIPLPYELKLKDAESTINYILDNIKKNEKVEKAEYTGVNKLDTSSINYQIKVYCKPIDKVQTRRDSLTCIVKCLEEKNISVPYTQIDIHNK